MTNPQAGGGAAGTFFNAQQRATIEAAMARIIPTDDQPGAREAGTIDFLDRYLSGLDFIYAKPDGSGFEKLQGKHADAWKRRIEIIRSKYAEGIRELDRRSRSQFGAEFVRLTCEQQDRILAGMEHPALQNEAGADEAKSAEPALQQTNAEVDLDFFSLLALHTRQGFYSDPIYGGNKNRVGWKLIGFEGPESLAETHAGRFTTLPFFAEQQIDWEEEKNYGSKA